MHRTQVEPSGKPWWLQKMAALVGRQEDLVGQPWQTSHFQQREEEEEECGVCTLSKERLRLLPISTFQVFFFPPCYLFLSFGTQASVYCTRRSSQVFDLSPCSSSSLNNNLFWLSNSSFLTFVGVNFFYYWSNFGIISVKYPEAYLHQC